mgnify:CR=1 FL=1
MNTPINQAETETLTLNLILNSDDSPASISELLLTLEERNAAPTISNAVDAIRYNLPNTVEALVECNSKLINSPKLLYTAAEDGNINICSILVSKGSDINSEVMAPLSAASKNGQYNTVKLLIENGALVTINNNEPLRLAKDRNRSAVIELLSSYSLF